MQISPKIPMGEHLYFLAVVPPEPIKTEIQYLREEFSRRYKCKHALKSPPHITLIPPFWKDSSAIADINTALKMFVSSYPVMPIRLEGYGAFKHRVIYLHVEAGESLTNFRSDLSQFMFQEFAVRPDARKPFTPLLTIAFKDLSRSMFYKAWDLYRGMEYSNAFKVNGLTLLQYKDRRWHEDTFFPFGA